MIIYNIINDFSCMCVFSPFCPISPSPLLLGPHNKPGPAQDFVLLKQEYSL